MSYKCPKCDSTEISTERRPNGDSQCGNCGHQDKTINFDKVKNSSINKMAEQFTSPEELKAYSDAQYKAILSLQEKLEAARNEVEKLRAENEKLKVASSLNTVPENSQFKVTDEETICVTQLAILKGNAMSRELTMDEVKRTEILVKTLQIIRGKAVDDTKKGKDTAKMTDAELLAWVEENTKEKQ